MKHISFKKENSAALIIKSPHITEKATQLSGQNSYTFLVETKATKKEIANAITSLYKVTPVKVNVINMPAKKVTRRGIPGEVRGFKKAVVFLKKGETIELI